MNKIIGFHSSYIVFYYFSFIILCWKIGNKMRRILSVLLLFLGAGAAFADTCDVAITRIKYGGGGDWYGNRTALPNLLRAIKERTRINICPEEQKTELTNPDLYSHPILFLNGHGNIRFTDTEITRLREFLLNGGFLFADDNYGMDASFRREMKRVFPDLSWMELPFSHPIYHCFYKFPNGLPKIHKHDGGPAQGLGLFNKGRLMVYYTFDTDLENGWEDIGTYDDPPEKHEEAVRMGINIMTYALTE
jgi:hypothetical protein